MVPTLILSLPCPNSNPTPAELQRCLCMGGALNSEGAQIMVGRLLPPSLPPSLPGWPEAIPSCCRNPPFPHPLSLTHRQGPGKEAPCCGGDSQLQAAHPHLHSRVMMLILITVQPRHLKLNPYSHAQPHPLTQVRSPRFHGCQGGQLLSLQPWTHEPSLSTLHLGPLRGAQPQRYQRRELWPFGSAERLSMGQP